MAQLINLIFVKPDELRSIPKACMNVEGES